MPFQDPSGRWLSDDGAYFWDGAAWRLLPPRVRGGPPAAVMALAIGCAALVLLGIVAAGVGAYIGLRNLPSTPPVAATRVRCQPAEQLAIHYHAHLTVIHDGAPVAIPAQVGIEPLCLYWLHTHDDSGIIHVETPASQGSTTFTLADFFAVWHQPIDRRTVGPAAALPGETIQTWVQPAPGSAPLPWEGAPGDVPLHNCSAITIEIGRPLTAPPAYVWPDGFLCGSG